VRTSITPAEAEVRVRDADAATRKILAITTNLMGYRYASSCARECRKMERAWGRVCERWLAEHLAAAVAGDRQAQEAAQNRAARAEAQASDWAVLGDRYQERSARS
jgi:hypothetical protein